MVFLFTLWPRLFCVKKNIKEFKNSKITILANRIHYNVLCLLWERKKKKIDKNNNWVEQTSYSSVQKKKKNEQTTHNVL